MPDGRRGRADVPDRDYHRINIANWNSRVAHHGRRPYGLERYASDPTHISDVVRFDLPRLGDIAGLDVVHLQCHIGTDTLSLARLGARMTGLDFSPGARRGAALGARSRSGRSSMSSATCTARRRARHGAVRPRLHRHRRAVLAADVRRWAQVVAALLRPGGRLFIREGHPMLWSLADPRQDGVVVIEFPYFETSGTVFDETTTYVEHEGEVEQPEIEFNHGLGEIITALMDAGLT